MSATKTKIPKQFGTYLEGLRERMACTSNAQLYQRLGGRKLKVSLRQFTMLCAAQRRPNAELVAKLMGMLPPHENKLCLVAFVASQFKDSSTQEAQGLLTYLNTSLLQKHTETTQQFWNRPDAKRPSESQLKTLIDDEETLRAHNKLLLEEKLTISEISPEVKQRLVSAKLAQVRGHNLVPEDSIFFRLPRYGSAPPKMVSLTNQYIAKVLEAYMSKEGSPLQSLEFAILQIRPDLFSVIQTQLTAFKNWVNSLSVDDPASEALPTQPFVFVTFGKLLSQGET